MNIYIFFNRYRLKDTIYTLINKNTIPTITINNIMLKLSIITPYLRSNLCIGRRCSKFQYKLPLTGQFRKDLTDPKYFKTIIIKKTVLPHRKSRIIIDNNSFKSLSKRDYYIYYFIGGGYHMICGFGCAVLCICFGELIYFLFF
jgi:hypothetical protein